MATVQRAKGAVQVSIGIAGRTKGGVSLGDISGLIAVAPVTVARDETDVQIYITGASASQGSAAVVFGPNNIDCPITSYPGSEGNLEVTIPTAMEGLYTAVGHTFTYTDDSAGSDTSKLVKFTPAPGRSYFALVSPLFPDNGYMLFGFTGTPDPVTTDQMEYDTVTPEDSIPNTPNLDSEWVLDSVPVSDQTSTVQIIRAATEVRSSDWTITWEVGGSVVISGGGLSMAIDLSL